MARDNLAGHPRCAAADLNGPFRPEAVADGPQIRWAQRMPPDRAVTVQKVPRGIALQLVRYDYDAEADQVPILPDFRFELRLPEPHPRATAVSPGNSMGVRVDVAGMSHQLILRDVPLYGIILWRSGFSKTVLDHAGKAWSAR